ncbi:cell adhesion molecule Dscam1-like [Brevipalpus obovatus]|uniref:cell adhesion molecule Dscam1-like n=1 Tax=Brevipalpus obovatus TaxID=246614 RepID=UPI003D9E63E7
MYPQMFLVVGMIALGSSNEQPKISHVQSRILSKVGKQASLTCILEQGSLPVDFKWLKGNDAIRSSENIVIETSQRISGLIIKSLAISDSGNYSCIIANSFGSDLKAFQLIVEGPPQWLSKPTDIQVGPREQFTIQCSGIGHPTPIVTWKKLVDSDWRDLFESTNTLTRISPTEISGHQLIKEKDEGKYGCEISNAIAPSLWSEFVIKVSGKATIPISNESNGAFEVSF